MVRPVTRIGLSLRFEQIACPARVRTGSEGWPGDCFRRARTAAVYRGVNLLLLPGCLLLFLCGGISTASAAYVTDQIPVTLRRGPGNEYRILKSLTSPAAVEIIEDGERYLKVRTADGTEGFMLKQYVVLQEPAAVVADRLQREQTTLRKKVADLSEQNRRLQALQSETGNTLEQTETALHKVKSQYEKLQEGAKDVTETLAERDRLQQENQEQRQQIASLKEENHYLWRNNILRWFFAGAGVLAIGWLMGRRPPRRSRSF